MTDTNGATVTAGARVLFRPACRDGGLWLRGTVRAVRQWTYQRPTVTVWEALVDDGLPTDPNLDTNGFHLAAWLEGRDVAVVPP